MRKTKMMLRSEAVPAVQSAAHLLQLPCWGPTRAHFEGRGKGGEEPRGERAVIKLDLPIEKPSKLRNQECSVQAAAL